MSIMNSWVFLLAGVVSEICGMTCLKFSDGFTRLVPSVAFVIFFAVSFYLFSISIRVIEIGIAYAVWAGLGIALVALVGMAVFGETLGAVKILAITLIVVGAIMLNLCSGTPQ